MQRETYGSDVIFIPENDNKEIAEVADLSIKKRKCRDDEVPEMIDLSVKKRKVDTFQESLNIDKSASSFSTSFDDETGGKKKSLRCQPFRAVRYCDSYNQNNATDQVQHGQQAREYDSLPDSSDSEEVELPLPTLRDLSEEELREKEKKLHKLREELRNEEMKLVLLKKLRQSQTVKENMNTAQPVPGKIAPSAGRSIQSNSGHSVEQGHHSVLHGKNFGQNLLQQSPFTISQLMRNQSIQGSSSVMMGPRSGMHSSLPANVMLQQSVMRPGSGSLSRTPVTTPPNVVMGYPAQNRSSGQQVNSGHAQSLPRPLSSSSPQTTQGSERMDNQTPAQRQAVAKLALRKQLEKTLLQIPPPKPPPPEMHFIPNANNQEFICLLGLEKIVDFMMQDNLIARAPPEPFLCVQCDTDFTPVWKWQDKITESGKKHPAVICEMCVTSNIKKALKAEHTNRLKTAFVKALQQEQEIEQSLSQVIPSPPPSTSPLTQVQSSTSTPTTTVFSNRGTPPPSSHSPIPRMSTTNPSAAAVAANSAALLQQIPKLTPAQQSILQAQAHQLHQIAQGLPHQPQPAHMIPFNPLLAQAYSYQMLGKAPFTSPDLQRQYLLDMIPPRSLPQSPMNWKS
ncbi:transcriptional repressor p66-beta-like [Tachypleus tridentatus]|uniref:transcriptional repressor p66-beta-like n=1 Tax=Tachypleus tridentatus TaxID=6853 RepID=UPI003FD13C95